MIPFYIYYSMFGFQRIGDLAWAPATAARGFLLGGTAGRTTLNGEGLQHEDGHSHIQAVLIPNCISYDPTLRPRAGGDLQDGMRRICRPGGRVLLHHPDERKLPHPALPGEGSREGHLGAFTWLKGRRRRRVRCN